MLGEFFAARPDEIESVVEAGPFGRFETVEAKGLTEVSLATLGEIMQLGAYDDLVERIGAGPEAESGEAGILPLPTEFRDALASIVDIHAVATKWAATEELELDQWQVSDAAEVLRDVAGLARRAQATSQQVLYWWSL
jgi:hypothetical protein